MNDAQQRAGIGAITVVLASIGGLVLAGAGATAAVAGVAQLSRGDGVRIADVEGVNSLDLDVGAADLTVRFDDVAGAQLQTSGDRWDGWTFEVEGDELVVEFTLLGQSYVGLNGGPVFTPNESVSFMVLTADQAETDRYWNAIIGNGGQESACGWCKDRWGYSWQITPRRLIELVYGADRDKARRAMEAMLTMHKIDIARIEAAAGA